MRVEHLTTLSCLLGCERNLGQARQLKWLWECGDLILERKKKTRQNVSLVECMETVEESMPRGQWGQFWGWAAELDSPPQSLITEGNWSFLQPQASALGTKPGRIWKLRALLENGLPRKVAEELQRLTLSIKMSWDGWWLLPIFLAVEGESGDWSVVRWGR